MNNKFSDEQSFRDYVKNAQNGERMLQVFDELANSYETIYHTDGIDTKGKKYQIAYYPPETQRGNFIEPIVIIIKNGNRNSKVSSGFISNKRETLLIDNTGNEVRCNDFTFSKEISDIYEKIFEEKLIL